MIPSHRAPVGVVIPTLNEEGPLERLLADLEALDVPLQVVVADGGSRDATRQVARRRAVRIVHGPCGRAHQMNAGARALPESPWLLFLHADTRLESGVADGLREWLDEAGDDEAGVFGFRLQGRRAAWRILEAGQRLRERTLGLPYGDQGLLVSRQTFGSVGGYPELPLMEDVAMVRRLKAAGVRLGRIEGSARTSPRRYEREGAIRGVARNLTLLVGYGLGASPWRLARWYDPNPREGEGANPPQDGSETGDGPQDPAHRHLLVFAKAPRPGQVKTRLAAHLGAERAAALYRTLGARVVHRLKEGPYRTEIHYDPPDAGASVEAWLGSPSELDFRSQVEGSLGMRLEEGLRSAFQRGARSVAVVGTDIPGLTPRLVTDAFHHLRSSDVVLGPAADGGYYLLAMSRLHSQLLEGIPWSTAHVLEATLEQAQRHGLSVSLLPELRDLDRPEDLDALALHEDLVERSPLGSTTTPPPLSQAPS